MQILIAVAVVLVGALPSFAAETLWIEAEHLDGVRGYCWPMGTNDMQRTDGHWGLSGPGWAAEWNQGGESGFLSIATGADDSHALASKTVEIPTAGTYSLWVRYGDWREQSERFEIRLLQPGSPDQEVRFGEAPVVEEDNEMKLYFGWAFGWEQHPVELLAGSCTIQLVSSSKEQQSRQVDVIVLTTDSNYRPRIKERPSNAAWSFLDTLRGGVPETFTPLARAAATQKTPPVDPPPEWTLRTFRDRGLLYLWNTAHTSPAETWLSAQPGRVRFPYNLIDPETRAEFEQRYGGTDDVPIFGDPRIVPTFHGVGAGIFATDPATGEVNPTGKLFADWLDAHPDRMWAMMMNYHAGAPIGERGVTLFQKYRDRFVGSISGESLGYFDPPADKMRADTANAKTRRELVEAFTPLSLAENAAKYRAVYGRDLDANAYQDVIPCLSVGNIAFAPLCFDWGARIVGYESAAATSSLLPMRMAFMRGLARQHHGMFASYRSCNFGDSSTIFSNGGSFHSPQNIYDNYYSVYSGAGMTWYKFDLWHQYMSGSSLFYHEQGFDEFWKPGGTTVAGVRPVELSPKGKLVDRFLRVTAANPDRGTPYTPVAFLVDYAHGWEPAPFWPNSFKNWHQHEERFRFGRHERMLESYFWTAYHPIGRNSEAPITATSEVNVPGVFGDIFDVIAAYPDVQKWRTIDSYPVVIAAGEIELTPAEGERLKAYVEQGGTLLVADQHLTGEGIRALQLPLTDDVADATDFVWNLGGPELTVTSRFRCRPIHSDGATVLATANGRPCCVSLDRGRGRLVYLSIPYGLTISGETHPAVPLLLAHLTRELMPVAAHGEVEWMVNRSRDGWIVLLMNPAGQVKPQQGITPTDYRQNQTVTITSRLPITTASDRLQPIDPLNVVNGEVRVEVPAGGVRLIELQ